jgi:hypothetical protein
MCEVVVPIVIYTGERTWQAPTPFPALVKGKGAFAAFIPATEPLFLSLPAAKEEELVQHGGVLGTVLGGTRVSFRNVNERDSLREELERAIQTQTVRKEIHSMGQTIAEALREEGERKGRIEGKQETLLLQLRQKFGNKVTRAVAASIHRTRDLRMLDEWLGNVVAADALEDVGVSVRK